MVTRPGWTLDRVDELWQLWQMCPGGGQGGRNIHNQKHSIARVEGICLNKPQRDSCAQIKELLLLSTTSVHGHHLRERPSPPCTATTSVVAHGMFVYVRLIQRVTV